MTGPAPDTSPTLQQLLARVHLRLILFAVLLAGVTLMISGVLVIRGYAERNLALIAHTVSYTVEPAVVFGDVDAVRSGMVSVAGNDAVRLVEVRDRSGHVMASWSRPANDLSAWIENAGGRLLWPSPVRARVRRGSADIAEVRVYGSAGGIGSYILSGTLIALICLGLAVMATQLLARRLQQDVIAPLDHVARVAHAVRTNREFDQRVSVSGIAEIDTLGQDFNALLAELQGWHAGLTFENEELLVQATRDMLTGLGNRTLFDRKLQATIEEAERYRTKFAVLFVDANRFKQINDSHGHDSGDIILKNIANRLKMSLRTYDEAFRMGGDEFAVVLVPRVDRNRVEAVIERIALNMQPDIALPTGDSLTVTLSIGFALYPDDGAEPGDLLRQADAAMYLDKHRRRSGGNAEPFHA